MVHAFGDNGASVYQFLQEEMRCLGLATALKAVVFHGGPSEYYTVIPVALREGGKVTDDQSWAHAAIVATSITVLRQTKCHEIVLTLHFDLLGKYVSCISVLYKT